MAQAAQIELLTASQVAQQTAVRQSENQICYAVFGDTHLSPEELAKIVQGVPESIAAALTRHAYYFVPLAIGEGEETTVASGYSVELSDRAICHRNVDYDGAECVFISTRLMQDRFGLAFEFFINAAHHFVDAAGVPQSFCDLLWSQAMAGVRGETSQDAHAARRRALDPGRVTALNGRATERQARAREKLPAAAGERFKVDEKAKSEFFQTAFSDALAIYMLSLAVDFHYSDLREREYPLLAPAALAERLRHVAELFPPNSGYEFQISYRHRN